jgi:hypothetical protein
VDNLLVALLDELKAFGVLQSQRSAGGVAAATGFARNIGRVSVFGAAEKSEHGNVSFLKLPADAPVPSDRLEPSGMLVRLLDGGCGDAGWPRVIWARLVAQRYR